jgi:hypothetical protein
LPLGTAKGHCQDYCVDLEVKFNSTIEILCTTEKRNQLCTFTILKAILILATILIYIYLVDRAAKNLISIVIIFFVFG